MSATITEPKTKALPSKDEQQEQPANVEESPTPSVPSFEDDDLVTVLLRGWNAFDNKTRQPLIRADQETYIDKIKFVGGIARNVSYADARKLVKLRLISAEHIFPDSAQATDFARVTGRDPLSAETLAGAIAALSPEKAAAILGDEAALAFAKSLHKLISNRPHENN